MKKDIIIAAVIALVFGIALIAWKATQAPESSSQAQQVEQEYIEETASDENTPDANAVMERMPQESDIETEQTPVPQAPVPSEGNEENVDEEMPAAQ